MHNFNLQLSGSTGSGKTSLVKYLLATTPRYFVFDPFEEYKGLNAWYTTKFETATEHLLRNHSAANYRVIFQGDSAAIWESIGDGENDEEILTEFRYMLRQLLYTMHFHNAPPLGLILEESHFYTMPDSRREPWPEIRSLYRFAGRRSSISSINIVQSHTDIAPEVRQGAATYVALRNTDPPVSLTRQFGDQLGALKPYQPGMKPETGVHYLTIPSGIDIIETWSQTMKGNHVLVYANKTSHGGKPDQPGKDPANDSGNSRSVSGHDGKPENDMASTSPDPQANGNVTETATSD